MAAQYSSVGDSGRWFLSLHWSSRSARCYLCMNSSSARQTRVYHNTALGAIVHVIIDPLYPLVHVPPSNKSGFPLARGATPNPISSCSARFRPTPFTPCSISFGSPLLSSWPLLKLFVFLPSSSFPLHLLLFTACLLSSKLLRASLLKLVPSLGGIEKKS